MDKERAKRHYWEQKCSAKRRNIDWGFTFDTWVLWWQNHLGPNWLSRRGRGSNKYHMARKRDKGPYHPKNVECITHNKNSRDKKQNGSQAHGEKVGNVALTTKQVERIFTANGCLRALAVKNGVTYHCIWDIKHQRNWVRVTSGLIPGKRCECSAKGISCIKGLHRQVDSSL